MRDILFKTASEARLEGLCDVKCAFQGGFIVKRFNEGYKYFPLKDKAPYLVRSGKIVELGEYVGTYCHLKTEIGLLTKLNKKKGGIVVPMKE